MVLPVQMVVLELKDHEVNVDETVMTLMEMLDLVSLEAGFSGLYDYRPDIGANTLGIVGVTAINSIRYPDRNGVYLGVGTGYYRGQSSIAIGVSKRSDNVSINFNVSSTGVVGAGVVWRFK